MSTVRIEYLSGAKEDASSPIAPTRLRKTLGNANVLIFTTTSTPAAAAAPAFGGVTGRGFARVTVVGTAVICTIGAVGATPTATQVNGVRLAAGVHFIELKTGEKMAFIDATDAAV